jgi:hypothetical protein
LLKLIFQDWIISAREFLRKAAEEDKEGTHAVMQGRKDWGERGLPIEYPQAKVDLSSSPTLKQNVWP